jgi:hypothetical protein
MTRCKETALELRKDFDPKSCRLRINGTVMVMHCHHYASLYTQLAMDCGMLDAKALLAECSESAWLDFLRDCYRGQDIADTAGRISAAEQIFAAAGLGKMRVLCAGPESGEAEMERSHVDQGWIKKWGKSDLPVNFIGAGFISALFSAVFDRPAGAYSVIERESIVSGAPRSRFTVVIR